MSACRGAKIRILAYHRMWHWQQISSGLKLHILKVGIFTKAAALYVTRPFHFPHSPTLYFWRQTADWPLCQKWHNKLLTEQKMHCLCAPSLSSEVHAAKIRVRSCVTPCWGMPRVCIRPYVCHSCFARVRATLPKATWALGCMKTRQWISSCHGHMT